MLSPSPAMWDLSDMSGDDELEGVRLYDAFMALKPSNLAETDWAERAGVNRGFFGNLKTKAKNPRRDTVQKLLRYIGKSEADLRPAPPAPKAGSRLPAPSPSQGLGNGANSDDTVEIQQLDLSLSMGPGTIIDDYVEAETRTFDLAFIRRITRSPPHRLRIVSGIGRSMEPTLQDGDIIMIDTTDTLLARYDGIYWISVYGASGLKRLRTIGPGRVLIKSDNPAVEDQEVPAEDLRIEGRAIWAARGL